MPLLFVTTDVGTPVAIFVAVTFAPGMTAPVGSATVPLTLPVTVWAIAGAHKVITAAQHKMNLFRMCRCIVSSIKIDFRRNRTPCPIRMVKITVEEN